MSRAKFSFRLSAMDKAILGVGRQAILYPEYMQDLFDTNWSDLKDRGEWDEKQYKFY